MYGYKTISRPNSPSLRYKLFNRTPSEALNSVVNELRTLSPNSSVLDLGCGDGILEFLAGDKRNYTFTSLDIEPNGIEEIKHIFSSRGIEGDTALVGDITELDQLPELTSKQYDACVSWRVLHGISPEHYDRIFSQIYDLLQPGGTLFISVACDKDWKRYALGKNYKPNGVNDCADVMFHNYNIPREVPFLVHFFALDELRSLGEKHGFHMANHGHFKEGSGYNHLKDKSNTYLFAEFIKQ